MFLYENCETEVDLKLISSSPARTPPPPPPPQLSVYLSFFIQRVCVCVCLLAWKCSVSECVRFSQPLLVMNVLKRIGFTSPFLFGGGGALPRIASLSPTPPPPPSSFCCKGVCCVKGLCLDTRSPKVKSTPRVANQVLKAVSVHPRLSEQSWLGHCSRRC